MSVFTFLRTEDPSVETTVKFSNILITPLIKGKFDLIWTYNPGAKQKDAIFQVLNFSVTIWRPLTHLTVSLKLKCNVQLHQKSILITLFNVRTI